MGKKTVKEKEKERGKEKSSNNARIDEIKTKNINNTNDKEIVEEDKMDVETGGKNTNPNINESKPEEETEWKKIDRKKRFKAGILAQDAPGENLKKKIQSITTSLTKYKSFLGANFEFQSKNRYIVVSFSNEEEKNEVCNNHTFEDSEFKFTSWDEAQIQEKLKNSLRLSCIPLYITKEIILKKMETFGKIKDIKFKLVRQWRSALIEYEDHQPMEN